MRSSNSPRKNPTKGAISGVHAMLLQHQAREAPEEVEACAMPKTFQQNRPTGNGAVSVLINSKLGNPSWRRQDASQCRRREKVFTDRSEEIYSESLHLHSPLNSAQPTIESMPKCRVTADYGTV